ncbi:MAG: type II toxin-antitoxin system HicA family toxin [Verrucomicrobiales bacterium]|nr:type II toxin-antitoxin system HicA family toxin [Verrucomicrobiales bacterium]
MSRLPSVTARQLIRVLQKVGFEEHHQRGSHRHLYHTRLNKWVTVPVHRGDIKRPLVVAILKQAGISEDQFRALR